MAAEPQSTEEEAPGTPPPAFKRTDLQRFPLAGVRLGD
jgi:hypothetical protein